MNGRFHRKGSPGRRAGRMVVISGLAAVLLAACGPQSNPQTFLDSLGPNPETMADQAFAALARGDFGTAEQDVEAALKRDPRNPYALLAGGILYQNTNRPVRARAMYEELLSLRPNKMAAVGGWDRMQVQPIAEIAAANMRRVDGELARTGAWQAASPYAAAPAAASGLAPVASPRAMEPAAVPRGAVQTMPFSGDAARPVQGLDARTRAVADRFLVLRKLRDEELVTPAEYQARRAANIGALLPLTESPPAKGLERPVPALDQVVERLKSLQQALQTRAITPREHAMERELILDALLPAKPAALAAPEAAPRDLIASADRVRQLEHLRTMGLITEAEQKAEQKAVEGAMRAPADAAPAEGAAGPRMLIPGGASAAPLPGQVSVHLASYRSMAQAQAGWTDVRQKFRPQLATLAPDIRKATVKGKGDFYRLYAGPISSRAEADKVCRALRAKRQFCSVSAE
ncbi:SPOR domain-containing protein [Oleispirillum naphthae]|uniref:SPOR domain-containing protein n=1 Tax=Oleispirillum naphthae TaxID=2838853 RepID=UPI00308254D7